MSKKELWDFAQTPQSCKEFLKVIVDNYWDKL